MATEQLPTEQSLSENSPQLTEIYTQKKKSKIALVVVTFNQPDLTVNYINRLLEQTLVPDIIVVDNSNDNTFEILKTKFPKITILKAKQNYGGAGGYYLGQKYAFDQGYGYVILSENDVFDFNKDLIENLYKAVKKNPTTIHIAENKLKHSIGGIFHFAIFTKQILEKAGYVNYNYFFRAEDYEYGSRLQSCGVPQEMTKDGFKHPVGGGAFKGAGPIYFLTRNQLDVFYNYESYSKFYNLLFLRVFTYFTYTNLLKDKIVSTPIKEGIKSFLVNKVNFKDSLEAIDRFRNAKIDYSSFKPVEIPLEELKTEEYFLLGEYSMSRFLGLDYNPKKYFWEQLKKYKLDLLKKTGVTVSYGSPGGFLVYFLSKVHFLNNVDYEKKTLHAYYYATNKSLPLRLFYLLLNLSRSFILTTLSFLYAIVMIKRARKIIR